MIPLAVNRTVRPCSDLVPGHSARALKWKLFAHTPVPGTTNVHKQLGKGNDYREISGKFGVANTTSTDENLIRLVPVFGHGARVLPLELLPVPGHGAQICARTPTKGYVQTGTATSLSRA